MHLPRWRLAYSLKMKKRRRSVQTQAATPSFVHTPIAVEPSLTQRWLDFLTFNTRSRHVPFAKAAEPSCLMASMAYSTSREKRRLCSPRFASSPLRLFASLVKAGLEEPAFGREGVDLNTSFPRRFHDDSKENPSLLNSLASNLSVKAQTPRSYSLLDKKLMPQETWCVSILNSSELGCTNA